MDLMLSLDVEIDYFLKDLLRKKIIIKYTRCKIPGRVYINHKDVGIMHKDEIEEIVSKYPLLTKYGVTFKLISDRLTLKITHQYPQTNILKRFIKKSILPFRHTALTLVIIDHDIIQKLSE